MSDTPEDRRERLLAALGVVLRSSDLDRPPAVGTAPAILDALLEVLEPPVATMVYGFRTKDPQPRARRLGEPTWYRPAIMMSETPEQRRERLLAAIQAVLSVSHIDRLPAESLAPSLLDGLLEAIEEPLAAMVRRGIVQNGPGFHRLDDGTVGPFGFTFYRPAP